MGRPKLRFGIRPHGWVADPTPFAEIVEWVVRAEALGFDSVHVADRLLSRVPPVYESTMYEVTACLATFAAHTRSMQLSPLVYNAPYRHPVLTAKVFASLDVASGGRSCSPSAADGTRTSSRCSGCPGNGGAVCSTRAWR